MTDITHSNTRLITLSGDVWLLDGDKQLPLGVGSELVSGQILQTGPHGTALLLLASGHELGLGPDQTLMLDVDVLADVFADTSEWTLATSADPALLADWLAPVPAALSLDAMLASSADPLDHLLGTSTHPGQNAPASGHEQMAAGMVDDSLSSLLRSLYGPDQGHN